MKVEVSSLSDGRVSVRATHDSPPLTVDDKLGSVKLDIAAEATDVSIAVQCVIFAFAEMQRECVERLRALGLTISIARREDVS